MDLYKMLCSAKGKKLIRPRNDRVLIERIEEPQKGLIIAPEIAKEKSIKGKILAIGPKCDVVKPGMLVLFNSKWSDFAPDFMENDWRYPDKLHLVQEADIFGIIDGSAH